MRVCSKKTEIGFYEILASNIMLVAGVKTVSENSSTDCPWLCRGSECNSEYKGCNQDNLLHNTVILVKNIVSVICPWS